MLNQKQFPKMFSVKMFIVWVKLRNRKVPDILEVSTVVVGESVRRLVSSAVA